MKNEQFKYFFAYKLEQNIFVSFETIYFRKGLKLIIWSEKVWLSGL